MGSVKMRIFKNPKFALILGIVADAMIIFLGILFSLPFIWNFDEGGHQYISDFVIVLGMFLPYVAGSLFCFSAVCLFIIIFESKFFRIAVVLNILSSLYAGVTFYAQNFSTTINYFNIYHTKGFLYFYARFGLSVILIFITLAVAFYRVFESNTMKIFAIIAILYSVGLGIFFAFNTWDYNLLELTKILIAPAKMFLYIGALKTVKNHHRFVDKTLKIL